MELGICQKHRAMLIVDHDQASSMGMMVRSESRSRATLGLRIGEWEHSSLSVLATMNRPAGDGEFAADDGSILTTVAASRRAMCWQWIMDPVMALLGWSHRLAGSQGCLTTPGHGVV